MPVFSYSSNPSWISISAIENEYGIYLEIDVPADAAFD